MPNPESRLTQSINREIRDLGVHAWKISDRFNAGVLDTWYSGNKSDLWVEYKWDPKPAKNVPIRAKLTEKQKDWIRNRHNEGRNIATIIGTPHGCIIYKGLGFEQPVRAKDARFMSKKEIVEWIRRETQH